MRGIHRRPVNSPHKWPVTRKMFPFDDVIMAYRRTTGTSAWPRSLHEPSVHRGESSVRGGPQLPEHRRLAQIKHDHYHDVIMSAMASQITSLTTINSVVYSGTDQRQHQSSASLAFVMGIHQWPVNSPHKGPVTRKMFPFDNVIMRFRDIGSIPRIFNE